MNNFFFGRLTLQLAIAITAFIFVVEACILVSSYYSKKSDLVEMNKVLKHKIMSGLDITKEDPITEKEIEEELSKFIVNVTILVLIIIVVVTLGTIFIFNRIAGRHIIRLKRLNDTMSLQNIQLYPEEDVPNNEVGDVILARNRSLKEMRNSTARISILGDIAAGISHEINTPLNVIHGNSQLLRMEIESGEEMDKEEVETNLSTIEATIVKLGRIVKGISSLSRDNDGEDFEKTELNEIFYEVKEFAHDKLVKSEVELKLNFEEKVYIYCRSFQIFQVFINMVKNSCDAILELDNKWIEVNLLDQDDHILVEVVDSGAGIPDEVKERMLEPYFTTKDVGKGTGLGLGFAKTIVDQHFGEIFIGKKGENTCISVKLPKDPRSVCKLT